MCFFNFVFMLERKPFFTSRKKKAGKKNFNLLDIYLSMVLKPKSLFWWCCSPTRTSYPQHSLNFHSSWERIPRTSSSSQRSVWNSHSTEMCNGKLAPWGLEVQSMFHSRSVLRNVKHSCFCYYVPAMISISSILLFYLHQLSQQSLLSQSLVSDTLLNHVVIHCWVVIPASTAEADNGPLCTNGN